jgi:hypothetical protein
MAAFAEIFLALKIFQTKVIKKTKHTLYVQERLSEKRAVKETMWENSVQSDRPQMAS